MKWFGLWSLTVHFSSRKSHIQAHISFGEAISHEHFRIAWEHHLQATVSNWGQNSPKRCIVDTPILLIWTLFCIKLPQDVLGIIQYTPHAKIKSFFHKKLYRRYTPFGPRNIFCQNPTPSCDIHLEKSTSCKNQLHWIKEGVSPIWFFRVFWSRKFCAYSSSDSKQL